MYSGPAIGIYSSPNPFTQTPAGTLKRADNVRFTSQGVIEPRRGFDYLSGATFGTSDSLADALAYYAGTILLAYDLTKVSLYAGSSFSDFTGTFLPVGANRMRFEGAARSCFFNTSDGLMVWDGTGVDDQPVLAGCPLGLNITAINSTTDGWQAANTAVAYRFTICRRDAYGRILEGPPSGRVVVRNLIESEPTTGGMSRTGGTVTVFTSTPHYLAASDVVTLTPGEANFPPGAKTIVAILTPNSFTFGEIGAEVSSYEDQFFEITRSNELSLWFPFDTAGAAVTGENFLRVYRSFETENASDTPSDELFQCYESAFLETAAVATGVVVFTDTTPSAVLEKPLYTNQNTGDGALAARYQPPLALDISYWANRMWYANTTARHSLNIALLGCGSPDGIQIGDLVGVIPDPGRISDIYSWAGVAAYTTPGATEFCVFTDGDPGYNIQQTAQSLCQQINAYPWTADFGLYAYYVSAEGGLPGQILLTARAFGDASGFQMYSDRPTAWAPQLPDPTDPVVPYPVGIPSDNNRHPAGLSYSPLGIPDAVPPANNLVVNSDNDAILRIFPLHYRLLIFKTDGIYTCTNVEPFSIQKLSAYVLLAPDSVQVLEDRVYALTDQGIVTISDAGVVEISDPIDDVFRALDAPAAMADVAARTFGLSYRSERQVLLWVPEKNDDGTFSDDNEQAYALSTMSQGFTRYPFGVRCGAINPTTNAMVVAPTDDNALWLENKSLTDADYYDLSTSLGVPVAVAGEELTFSLATAALIEAGDVLGSSGANYVVTDVSGATVTTNGVTGWTTGTTITLYKAIECTVEFNKLTNGAPADLKMTNQASFLFRQNGIHDVNASFSSEITTDPEEVTLSATGWGEFAWGAGHYGSPTEQIRRIEPLPESVAQCAQLSVGFSTRQALAKFEFLGIDTLSKKDTGVNRG